MKGQARALTAGVIEWQRRHGRHDLPWQNTRDPYRVWLSEIMLQQTQVATVLGYYGRFLRRFPDVAALAAAPLDDVLAQWSGLGYYGRARLLHRCAQVVVDAHGGAFPRECAALERLPGIGRSTAAAIAVFCHGERAAILDGNVKRVLTRALGFAHDLSQPRWERELWRRAEALLPDADVEAYTQGLMDLGATLCTARKPDCTACPLASTCAAHLAGTATRFPVKSRRPARHRRHSWLLWLSHRDRVWLVRRPTPGVWAGLWSFAEFDDEPSLAALTGDWPGRPVEMPAVTHLLTHRDWLLQPMRWRWPDGLSARERGRLEAPLPHGQWHAIADALALGLPAPVRRWLEAPIDAVEGAPGPFALRR